jgi:hypothetical protein
MTNSEPDLISLDLAENVERFVGFVFGGVHRVRRLECKGHYYLCIPHGPLSTFDDDKLTRIVIAGHKYGLRAEIDNHGMRGLKILLHNRSSREGRLFQRHPTIETVLQELTTEW